MFKKWFPFTKEEAPSKRRLFCFSHSGAGASVFFKWLKFHSPELEVCPVQLPGRESRIAEKPYSDMISLIDSLVEILKDNMGSRPIFFGHSLGGSIAFECGKRFQEKRVTVAISSALPPGKKKKQLISHLPDSEFLKEIIGYGGISQELMKEKELLQIILPTLRADIQLSESYIPANFSKLKGTLIALGSLEDPLVSSDDLLEWGKYVSGPFFSHFFEGDHFYYQAYPELVFRTLTSLIKLN